MMYTVRGALLIFKFSFFCAISLGEEEETINAAQVDSPNDNGWFEKMPICRRRAANQQQNISAHT